MSIEIKPNVPIRIFKHVNGEKTIPWDTVEPTREPINITTEIVHVLPEPYVTDERRDHYVVKVDGASGTIETARLTPGDKTQIVALAAPNDPVNKFVGIDEGRVDEVVYTAHYP
jgi:hypothetical protein